jgi:flavorubredoxin
MTITNDIRYIGVNDHDIDLFEGQYIVPEGMAYNSYVIIDEKIAVMDTVSADFGEEWLANLENVLAGRKPDYLIIHHMEPDHSANIDKFVNAYPEATIVGNAKTFEMIDQFFGRGLCKNKLAVKNGDTLSLGRHELTFLFAPMVHWPEVMMSYDETDKALFSADAFGKFGALDCQDKEWDCEARRYYMGIVGKYGMQVQAVLNATADKATLTPQMQRMMNRQAENTKRVEETIKGTKSNPRWFVPLFCAFMIIGLIWCVVYYLSPSGSWPIPNIGAWNLGIGFALIMIGFLMTMGWR